MTLAGSIYVNIHKVESRCWHALKDFSLKHPHIAPALSIIAAVGTLFKWIVLFPAFGVENIIFACRAFRDYTKESIPDQKQEHLKHCVSLLFKGIFGLTIGTAAGAILGALLGVVTFGLTLLNPLRTAKIGAGESDLNVLLAPLTDKSETAILLTNLFSRQKKHVESLRNNVEIAQYQFLDKNTVRNEVEDKLNGLEGLPRALFDLVARVFREDGELAEQIQRVGIVEEGLRRFKNRQLAQNDIPGNPAPRPIPA